MDKSTKTQIHDEVFMFDDPNESNPVQVYLDETNNIFYTEDGAGEVRKFILSKPYDEIVAKHRDEVLQYRLGTDYDADERVQMIDIFMHSKFITELKKAKGDILTVGGLIEKLSQYDKDLPVGKTGHFGEFHPMDDDCVNLMQASIDRTSKYGVDWRKATLNPKEPIVEISVPWIGDEPN